LRRREHGPAIRASASRSHALRAASAPPPAPPAYRRSRSLGPVNGAAVSGTVALAANASDGDGVASVEFSVDGALATDTTSLFRQLGLHADLDGSHTISARATDMVGTPSALATVTNL
jgi:hypothetical protein